jgi:SPP1 gp7 family putative phage head morphogenesis protein
MASEFVLDAITRHQMWLQQFAAGQSDDIKPYLKSVDKLVREELSKYDVITYKKDLKEINKRLKAEISALYLAYVTGLSESLEEMINDEVAFTEETMEQDGWDIGALDVALFALGLASTVQTGAKGQSVVVGVWLNQFPQQQTDLILNAIQTGYQNGTSTRDIIRTIRGTRQFNFRDGLLQQTNNSADRMARTLTNFYSNEARMAVYEQIDGLEFWEFVAVLDNRTSKVCMFNDGKVWPLGQGRLPPLHMNCRSMALPWSEGDQSTSELTGYEWLKRQPESVQNDVLGVTQAELFRNGGLSADEFRRLVSTSMGKPLTLEEIRRKNPQAWERAGLDDEQ